MDDPGGSPCLINNKTRNIKPLAKIPNFVILEGVIDFS